MSFPLSNCFIERLSPSIQTNQTIIVKRKINKQQTKKHEKGKLMLKELNMEEA